MGNLIKPVNKTKWPWFLLSLAWQQKQPTKYQKPDLKLYTNNQLLPWLWWSSSHLSNQIKQSNSVIFPWFLISKGLNHFEDEATCKILEGELKDVRIKQIATSGDCCLALSGNGFLSHWIIFYSPNWYLLISSSASLENSALYQNNTLSYKVQLWLCTEILLFYRWRWSVFVGKQWIWTACCW